MAVSEKSVSYWASDGKEFSDRAEAERHDEVVLATRAYDDALTALMNALAAESKTADGHLLDLRSYHTYYYLTEHYRDPSLIPVGFTLPRIDVNDRGDITLSVTNFQRPHDSLRYSLSRLYYDERAGQIALIAAKTEILAEIQHQVRDLTLTVYGELDEAEGETDG